MSADPTDYLAHLLDWGLPLVAVQWIAGSRTLWRRRRAVVGGAFLPALWFALGDHYAIRQGIWGFDQTHLLGVTVVDVPVEELLFFAVTGLLVSQSVTLLVERSGPRPQRTVALVDSNSGARGVE